MMRSPSGYVVKGSLLRCKWVSFLICAVVAGSLVGTVQTIGRAAYLQEARIYWHPDLPLSWDEFRGQIPADRREREAFALDVGVEWHCSFVLRPAEGEGVYWLSVVPEGLVSQAYMRPMESWFDESVATDVNLQFARLLFDIYHVFAMRLRDELMGVAERVAGPAAADAWLQNLARSVIDECGAVARQCREETENGSSAEQIANWRSLVDEWIDSPWSMDTGAIGAGQSTADYADPWWVVENEWMPEISRAAGLALVGEFSSLYTKDELSALAETGQTPGIRIAADRALFYLGGGLGALITLDDDVLLARIEDEDADAADAYVFKHRKADATPDTILAAVYASDCTVLEAAYGKLLGSYYGPGSPLGQKTKAELARLVVDADAYGERIAAATALSTYWMVEDGMGTPIYSIRDVCRELWSISGVDRYRELALAYQMLLSYLYSIAAG